MTVVTVGIIGIMTVLMAVQLKSMKGEYGLYLVLAAACVIFFYGTLRLRGILEGMQKIQNMIRINPVYLNTLLKMTGITYIAEFSSGICKDAGYGALGTQIEIFGKLSILAVSLPVILALLDTLQGLWHEAGEQVAGFACNRPFFIRCIQRAGKPDVGYGCGWRGPGNWCGGG